MPRGGSRRTYVRDGNGRFASAPGGGTPKRPAAKRVSRGTNRLTRDNSGRIAGVGKNGATARGGRLRTAAGNLRATQTDRLKGAPKGVVSRAGKGRATAAKKPIGWMQSPEARKDRSNPLTAAHRKDQARRLRALPKAAQRAIRIESMNRRAISRERGVGSNRQRLMRDIAEGRVILMGNVGKRKNKRSSGEVEAIARQMNRSATRLKAGLVTGVKGRMKNSPRAVESSARGAAARKISAARPAGTTAKPKGLKPGAIKAKRQKPAAPKRTAEEQARRDLIARGLKKLPKEKRARAIAMRREMEGRATAPGQPKPRMTQKERWLNRANVYERAAQRNMERIAQIERKHAPYRGDIAFNTQPGRIPLRERMIREQERGFELRKKAQAQLQRAQELRNLATTNKGDAERKRQAKRDAVTLEKGARMSTRLYGPGRVVRVNKKTVSYYSEQTGSVINVDKSWVMTS